MAQRKGSQIKDLIGSKFTRYTVKSFVKIDTGGNSVWLCKCDCGSIKEVRACNLNNGHSKSCGCLNQENLQAASMIAKTKHGLSRTKGYVNAKTRNYQASKLQRTPSWSDLQKIREIYLLCPKGYDVDHIIPLQSKIVSGLHVPENLQYLPSTENKSKTNKFEPTI